MPRDPFAEGQALMAYLTEEKFPGAAHNYDRIIRWYCNDPNFPPHPELPEGPKGYEAAYIKIVKEHAADSGANLTNAIGQDRRNEDANIVGNVFNGPVDVERLQPYYQHLDDLAFMASINSRFNARAGRTIWSMLRGSQNEVNRAIEYIGSTYAGMLGTFDARAYQGFMRAVVEDELGVTVEQLYGG